MSTKLEKVLKLKDELTYSVKSPRYARNSGGIHMLQLSNDLVITTYEVKRDKEAAEPLWKDIEETIVDYRGPYANDIKENITNLNIKT